MTQAHISRTIDDSVDRAGAPLVSIVITALNAQAFIGACIRAALAQEYPNFEVVVVDDGSTDATPRICGSFADDRLRCLCWGRLGRQRALNAGVAAARGRYIAINDADDLSLPHRVRDAVTFLQRNPHTAYLGTGFAETDVFLETLPNEPDLDFTANAAEPPRWPRRSELFRRNLFNHSTLVYPKSTWEKIGGYDETLTMSEDYDFYLRALQCGPAALLPGCTVLWYTNPDGFFKQKNRKEHLETLARIKLRAHGLLGLPHWMRLYHPAWAVYFELGQQFPILPQWVDRIRGTATKRG